MATRPPCRLPRALRGESRAAADRRIPILLLYTGGTNPPTSRRIWARLSIRAATRHQCVRSRSLRLSSIPQSRAARQPLCPGMASISASASACIRCRLLNSRRIAPIMSINPDPPPDPLAEAARRQAAVPGTPNALCVWRAPGGSDHHPLTIGRRRALPGFAHFRPANLPSDSARRCCH